MREGIRANKPSASPQRRRPVSSASQPQPRYHAPAVPRQPSTSTQVPSSLLPTSSSSATTPSAVVSSLFRPQPAPVRSPAHSGRARDRRAQARERGETRQEIDVTSQAEMIRALLLNRTMAAGQDVEITFETAEAAAEFAAALRAEGADNVVVEEAANTDDEIDPESLYEIMAETDEEEAGETAPVAGASAAASSASQQPAQPQNNSPPTSRYRRT